MLYRIVPVCLFVLLFAATAQAQWIDRDNVIAEKLQLRPCDDPAHTCSHSINDLFILDLDPIGETSMRKPRADAAGRATAFMQNGLYEIGLMANTYCMMGDNRNQVACDPLSDNVAVVFRGNDRSQESDGNTLYIRYSGDHGSTWTPQGNNVATSAEPRYPNIFLPNDGSGVHTALTWPQVVTFGNGNEDFGQLNSMRSEIGNGNPSYGTVNTPPNWSIPWSMVQDQSTGDLYCAAEAVEPSNGAATGDIFLLRSTDGGAQWNPVNLGEPFFEPNLVPNGFVGLNLRLDLSPDGSTMIAAWSMIIESEPGRANLLDDHHEIAWRISTNKGVSWGEPQSIRIEDIANRPAPFEHDIKQSWDLDVILDYHNRPHFLTVCSADLNPFNPFDEAPTDTTIGLRHVDSTFTTEIVQDDDGSWHVVPIGPVYRVRTDRLSFTAASADDEAYTFRNEVRWARSRDGVKLYAKWITPYFSWTVADVAGTPTLFQDTITQLYANGRHVDSRHDRAWTYRWDFAEPDHNSFAMDSLMRLTSLDDVGAKFSKLAYYAGDGGQLHIIFTEWGVGETPDDDPVYSDQVVWYLGDVVIPVTRTEVERVDTRPASFAIEHNSPNPFVDGTFITFTLPGAMQVRLTVYDMLGRRVAVLADGLHAAGTHRARFDAASLPEGMYICRLESQRESTSRKMMLTR